jgi:putative glutamine amidotransferase
MKKLAISQRLVRAENNEIRESLDLNYSKLFHDCGYLPIPISYAVDFKKCHQLVNFDGVVITGGNDLSIFNSDYLSIIRDDFEYKLIKFCLEQSIPVLGICRGMQLIANFFGADIVKVSKHVGTTHELIVNSNSRYVKFLKKIHNVNSFHNYGILSVSDDFIISAKAEDGVIEAFEHKTFNLFGQMWHSERGDYPFNTKQINLIKALF